MTLDYTQKELQAATYASLRAHPVTAEAKALVAMLSAMVEEHTIQTGLRKNRRKDPNGKLAYATGAFLADLLRPLWKEEQKGWVYAGKNCQARSFAAFVSLIKRHRLEKTMSSFDEFKTEMASASI